MELVFDIVVSGKHQSMSITTLPARSSFFKDLNMLVLGTADKDRAIIEIVIRDMNTRVLAILADVLSVGIFMERVSIFRRVLARALGFATPVLRVLVDDSGSLNVRPDCEFGVKCRRLRVEYLLFKDSLSELQVGTSQRFGFPILKGTVCIVEALRACACGGRQVLVILELPIGPADQILISHIANLSDLLGAGAFGQASTKLRDVQWHTETFGISCTRSNTLPVPGEALVSEGWVRLSSRAG